MSKAKLFKAVEPQSSRFRKMEKFQIDSIISNIERFVPEGNAFRLSLNARISEFDAALLEARKINDTHKQMQVLQQYQNFAITLEKCFLNPNLQDIECWIENYQERYGYYHPVGKLDPVKPLSFFENTPVLAGLGVGSLLALGGAIALGFHFLAFGLPALVLAAIAVGVALVIYFNPPAPEAYGIKDREAALFREVARVCGNSTPANDNMDNTEYNKADPDHLKLA